MIEEIRDCLFYSLKPEKLPLKLKAQVEKKFSHLGIQKPKPREVSICLEGLALTKSKQLAPLELKKFQVAFKILSPLRHPLVDECLDRMLGLNEREIQFQLSQKNTQHIPGYHQEDTYLEYPSKDLYTPYHVLQEISRQFQKLKVKKIVDLGCGHGRVGIFLGLFYPSFFYCGIEIVKERLEQAKAAARNLKLKNLDFQNLNLATTNIPKADLYFLFNPFSPRTSRIVLNELENKPSYLCVAKVGVLPKMIERRGWNKIGDFATHLKWEGKGFSLFSGRLVV